MLMKYLQLLKSIFLKNILAKPIHSEILQKLPMLKLNNDFGKYVLSKKRTLIGVILQENILTALVYL